MDRHRQKGGTANWGGERGIKTLNQWPQGGKERPGCRPGKEGTREKKQGAGLMKGGKDKKKGDVPFRG